MTVVIVHAGFHKTGTSALQEFLGRNRAALKPYFDFYANQDFPKAGSTSRIYGQRPFFWRRLQFRRAFRKFLENIPDAGTIVLSRETFAGVMPGHRDIFWRQICDQSTTAITLGREIINALKSRFGPDTSVRFIYTTRAQETWIRSVHGHLPRSINLTQDIDTFRASFTPLPDPETDARTIATALAPVPVYIARLEDFADHVEGTAAAILDLVDVPDAARAGLIPARKSNPGQSPEIEAEFLRLNRSGQNRKTVKKIKDQILKSGAIL